MELGSVQNFQVSLARVSPALEYKQVFMKVCKMLSERRSFSLAKLWTLFCKPLFYLWALISTEGGTKSVAGLVGQLGNVLPVAIST